MGVEAGGEAGRERPRQGGEASRAARVDPHCLQSGQISGHLCLVERVRLVAVKTRVSRSAGQPVETGEWRLTRIKKAGRGGLQERSRRDRGDGREGSDLLEVPGYLEELEVPGVTGKVGSPRG